MPPIRESGCASDGRGEGRGEGLGGLGSGHCKHCSVVSIYLWRIYRTLPYVRTAMPLGIACQKPSVKHRHKHISRNF